MCVSRVGLLPKRQDECLEKCGLDFLWQSMFLRRFLSNVYESLKMSFYPIQIPPLFAHNLLPPTKFHIYIERALRVNLVCPIALWCGYIHRNLVNITEWLNFKQDWLIHILQSTIRCTKFSRTVWFSKPLSHISARTLFGLSLHETHVCCQYCCESIKGTSQICEKLSFLLSIHHLYLLKSLWQP